MNPNYNEMSFDEAVEHAKIKAGYAATPPADTTIINLALHPDGLWTVQWIITEENAGLIYEEPLNMKDK